MFTRRPLTAPPFALRICARLVAALSLLLLAGCITDISVARHSDIALSDAEAEAILAEFSAVVNTADTPDDVACSTDEIGQYVPALYVIDGSVGIHNGPSEINSQGDLTAVLNEPGYAKIVSAINWCGDFGPNIIGCAPIPGDSFAVVRTASALEGILWAHEFGHTVGLAHRTDSLAIMRATIGANNRNITASECELFLDKVNEDYYQPPGDAARPDSGGSQQALDSARGATVDGVLPHQGDTSRSVIEFVRKVYPHGTPMRELVNMDPGQSLPTLRAMLWSDQDAPYWGNVVVALGLFGDASDAAAMITFITEQATLLTLQNKNPDSGNARAGLMALGYLANRTGEQTALDFLAGAMLPDAWQGANDIRRQLATTAHIGMAFSGQAPPQRRAARGASVISDSLAQDLQALGDEIASRGVRGYYTSR